MKDSSDHLNQLIHNYTSTRLIEHKNQHIEWEVNAPVGAPEAMCVLSIISSISSAAIIFAIYKSQQKLSNVYNRIMFGMSIANIIGCSAFAIATGKPSLLDSNDFCKTQGFLVYFGIM